MLIDSDVFTDWIRGNMPLDVQDRLILALEEQPEAYNIDLVVKKMKQHSRVMSTREFPHTYHKAIGIRKCEEIIRNGGI